MCLFCYIDIYFYFSNWTTRPLLVAMAAVCPAVDLLIR